MPNMQKNRLHDMDKPRRTRKIILIVFRVHLVKVDIIKQPKTTLSHKGRKEKKQMLLLLSFLLATPFALLAGIFATIVYNYNLPKEEQRTWRN